MGIGAALQQIGGGLMNWGMQRKDQKTQVQQQQDEAAKQQKLLLERQAALQRLQVPPEKIVQLYDEQLKKAVNVRSQWQINPEGTGGTWVETGRDPVLPKDKQPQVISGWQGDKQVTGVIDPDDPASFKPLFSGAPPKTQAASGSGAGGRGKAPPGYRYTEDGDLEAIPGGPAAAKEAAAEAKGKTFSSSEKKNIAGLRQSLGALDAIEAQLNAAEAAYEPLKGSFSAGGGGQGMLPTEAGKRFDAAVSQLAPLMRQLTRVPGEGAMSDYESKLLEQGNLNRRDYEATTAEKFKNLRTLVNEMRQSRASALDVYGPDAVEGPKAAAAAAPSAAPQGYKVGDIITEGGKRYRVIGGTPDDPEVEPL